MRVTISHNKPRQEVMQLVDRSFDDLFRGLGPMPVQLIDEKRAWQGSTMHFSLSARMGFVSTPIKGTVDVTDKDMTIDADLGFLERFLPTATVQQALTSRVRGLLT